MRVLGIDPGLRRLGWGIIDAEGSRLRHVANGVCESQGGDDLATRLLALHRQLTEVLTRFAPQIAAVEQTFVNKDAVGTLKLGQARGAVLSACGAAGLEVREHAARAVKKAVVGTGGAEKTQVQAMLKVLLPGAKVAGADAADALAVAIADAHSR